ncbi:MAG: hypothetical protein HGA50_15835, partial [Deltaproteobacteria bacterium]|nr:hypothetical protein [Deltaproteobacteria bacterium]
GTRSSLAAPTSCAPLSLSRPSELPSGKILLGFKRRLADGTVGLELEPLAFLRRLASLVPPPGSHDTAYFGILSSHSAHRRKFVRAACSDLAREGLRSGDWLAPLGQPRVRRLPHVIPNAAPSVCEGNGGGGRFPSQISRRKDQPGRLGRPWRPWNARKARDPLRCAPLIPTQWCWAALRRCHKPRGSPRAPR